ncbi:MAG: hypothetical protein A3F82_10975 [Deltaproteobacteria bacterium RIFCSPLOWO2_12_FULL_44_12]|nr:MAG: hypothetical protein A2712_08980 [Deltaproteobacteria bacterium RIFCSPHIGHO2_01_FULL_43_49]OGQ27918.1 MAG: hypothetical protein A3D98_06730 [Deltaproteobacteria bacterium RIFCSPHIGHO2_12_FULL_44_21]OGQ31130.1 MAG: hypothetical protein A2979_06780 [Deltaproteobacteria bacterium RIFCSPLOWO2_01_FULL_45_74]OGQ43121.1 MAG: hypothetical protein A3I70_00435 [Deltaproteobacteria bacterium RIFCSPLOWO2_02_FULL_44_34]OGQ69724.1 MAG: hypothetical protein A3F82_10975 [Deltaproteobacteria bacterium R
MISPDRRSSKLPVKILKRILTQLRDSTPQMIFRQGRDTDVGKNRYTLTGIVSSDRARVPLSERSESKGCARKSRSAKSAEGTSLPLRQIFILFQKVA